MQIAIQVLYFHPLWMPRQLRVDPLGEGSTLDGFAFIWTKSALAQASLTSKSTPHCLASVTRTSEIFYLVINAALALGTSWVVLTTGPVPPRHLSEIDKRILLLLFFFGGGWRSSAIEECGVCVWLRQLWWTFEKFFSFNLCVCVRVGFFVHFRGSEKYPQGKCTYEK